MEKLSYSANYEKIDKDIELHESGGGSCDSKLNTGEASGYGTTDQQPGCPDTHLSLSLLALFLCCPCGLAACRSSLKVKRKFRQGDVEGANASSERALYCSSQSFRFIFFFCVMVVFIFSCAALFGLFYGIDSFRYK